ncbi:MAG: ankyrin repeat domain-containing protein, partial [Pyrinomonadaceae bacterium]
LLEHGAKKTPLSNVDGFAAACLSANAQRARALLISNPELVSQLGTRRVELLQLAAESKKPDAVRLMVELGFDLNEISRTTPLHNAAMMGDLEMVKLLIELGASPLIRDTEFNATPQGWAEYGGKTEVAAYLKNFEES